jgi:hypothetical protein
MSKLRLLLCLPVLISAGRVALADMQILSAPASQTDRFSGSGSFAFSQYDFSGVGNFTNGTGVTGTSPGSDGTYDAAGIGTGPWGTLISPTYFLTAAHDAPAVGTNLNFYGNGTSATIVVSDQIIKETQLTFVDGNGAVQKSDLVLGQLAQPATGVTYYSIAADDQAALTRSEIVTVGRPYRVGTSTIAGLLKVTVPGANQGDSIYYTYPSNPSNPFNNYLINGDSGGPAFVHGPGNQLQLVGINWWNGTVPVGTGNSMPASGDSYVPEYAAEIQQLMSVPEPSSLVLTAVGALGLAAACRLRLRRARAASTRDAT